jgi:hypothetical protein
MFTVVLNFIDSKRLAKIEAMLTIVRTHRKTERDKQDACIRNLAPYSRPMCGMERHPDYLADRARLKSEERAHAHAVARDDAAYSALLKRSLDIQQRMNRRVSDRKQMTHSLHRSASFH